MSRSQTVAAIVVIAAAVMLGAYLGGYLAEDDPAQQSAAEFNEPQPTESREASVGAIIPVSDDAPADPN